MLIPHLLGGEPTAPDPAPDSLRASPDPARRFRDCDLHGVRDPRLRLEARRLLAARGRGAGARRLRRRGHDDPAAESRVERVEAGVQTRVGSAPGGGDGVRRDCVTGPGRVPTGGESCRSPTRVRAQEGPRRVPRLARGDPGGRLPVRDRGARPERVPARRHASEGVRAADAAPGRTRRCSRRARDTGGSSPASAPTRARAATSSPMRTSRRSRSRPAPSGSPPTATTAASAAYGCGTPWATEGAARRSPARPARAQAPRRPRRRALLSGSGR
jgi:hypothetical protein